MAQKATTTKTAPKKTTATAQRTSATSAKTSLSDAEHAQAAYFNWLKRGAPLWDDQSDWFSVKKGR